jgi:hypothetical protein
MNITIKRLLQIWYEVQNRALGHNIYNSELDNTLPVRLQSIYIQKQKYPLSMQIFKTRVSTSKECKRMKQYLLLKLACQQIHAVRPLYLPDPRKHRPQSET